MLPTTLLRAHFDAALPYAAYARTGNSSQRESWQKVYDHASLTEAQSHLVRAFPRDMKVLVSSGVWCGDCVQQCPLLARIAEANPERVDLRFVDRDEHIELAEKIMFSAGLRVPVAIFMAEDFEFIGLYGDRTLSRYRAVAQRQLGASCPLPGAPLDPEEMKATLQDWLDEFERMNLMLRLSTRLRQKHGD